MLITAKKPECASDESSLCSNVWELTGKNWLAASSEWLIAKPGAVIGIIIGALIVRWLVRRAIRRLTRPNSQGKLPLILRPLKERAPAALAVTGLTSERRQQRTETIGSILRHISSIVIMVIAGMMILNELGLELGPLLASAGIVGVALGFGAQALVKDVLAGTFMILEDQYGVGDIIDMGEASGTVEAVGFRMTTLRDVNGVVWYVRNGEVLRVGNKSQGWARVIVDIPVPFGTDVDAAVAVMRAAGAELTRDPEFSDGLLEEPETLGVEQIGATGMMLRITVKTTSQAQWTVARELRARVSAALDDAGIESGIPPTPPAAAQGNQP